MSNVYAFTCYNFHIFSPLTKKSKEKAHQCDGLLFLLFTIASAFSTLKIQVAVWSKGLSLAHSLWLLTLYYIFTKIANKIKEFFRLLLHPLFLLVLLFLLALSLPEKSSGCILQNILYTIFDNIFYVLHLHNH